MDRIKHRINADNYRSLQFKRFSVNLHSPHPSSLAIAPDYSMGGNEGGGRGGDRWSLFGGARPVVQKSPTDPGSDSNSGRLRFQSFFGLQKSTTLDGIKSQADLASEDPASLKSPKLELSGAESKKTPALKLKHRDMNILTPSGF